MARQYKKILKKIHPKPKRTPDKPQEKVGRDYLLVVIMAITILFMVVGWEKFTLVNRVLYVALTVALSTTYARRHYDFTEKQDLWAERLGYVAIAVSTIAFVVNVYQNFFAS